MINRGTLILNDDIILISFTVCNNVNGYPVLFPAAADRIEKLTSSDATYSFVVHLFNTNYIII